MLLVFFLDVFGPWNGKCLGRRHRTLMNVRFLPIVHPMWQNECEMRKMKHPRMYLKKYFSNQAVKAVCFILFSLFLQSKH